jgi:hypothetical protein
MTEAEWNTLKNKCNDLGDGIYRRNVGNTKHYQFKAEKIYTEWREWETYRMSVNAPTWDYGKQFMPNNEEYIIYDYIWEQQQTTNAGEIFFTWWIKKGKRYLLYYEVSYRFRLGSISSTYRKRTATWHDERVEDTYKKRSKTWVDANDGSPEIPGSGIAYAVSSVNTSFTSFSVNTTGISLGGDGSHSHTISIPTSGSSNENGHTHTVSASGIADINVSGSTISGGTHNHTFDFIYNELKDISNQNTKIATETTVKNRQMRIWRRTA